MKKHNLLLHPIIAFSALALTTSNITPCTVSAAQDSLQLNMEQPPMEHSAPGLSGTTIHKEIEFRENQGSWNGVGYSPVGSIHMPAGREGGSSDIPGNQGGNSPDLPDDNGDTIPDKPDNNDGNSPDLPDDEDTIPDRPDQPDMPGIPDVNEVIPPGKPNDILEEKEHSKVPKKKPKEEYTFCGYFFSYSDWPLEWLLGDEFDAEAQLPDTVGLYVDGPDGHIDESIYLDVEWDLGDVNFTREGNSGIRIAEVSGTRIRSWTAHIRLWNTKQALTVPFPWTSGLKRESATGSAGNSITQSAFTMGTLLTDSGRNGSCFQWNGTGKQWIPLIGTK